MSLTVPRAPTGGGRAAQLRFEEDRTGDIVAQFGQAMMQVGERIAQDQEQRGLGRARVQTAQRLNDIQQQYQQVGDPDEIDRGVPEALRAARQEIVDSAPAGIREQVGLTFDEMSVPHQARLGGRAIELRQSQELATLSSFGNELVRAAGTADPETQAAYRAQFDDHLAGLVQRGVIAPDVAERTRQSVGGEMESARARRLLSEDPDALVAAIDGGQFPSMGGDQIEGWRARGIQAVQTRAAQAEAQAKQERNEQIGAAKELFKDGAAVLRKGLPFAGDVDAAALMQDPEIAALPEAREYIATVELTRARPDLSVLPPKVKRDLLAEMERQSADKEYEADRVDALRKMIDADEKGFREDPLTHAAQIGLKPPPELMDPAGAAEGDLVAGLKARANYAATLAQAGYTEDPKFFTPAEREQWSKLVDKAASPQDRVRVAGDILVALGPGADAAVDELGGDPVFKQVQRGMVQGLSPQTARQIFEGQRIIDGKQVRLPEVAVRREAFFSEVYGLFQDGVGSGWKDQSGARDRVIEAADALYAYKMRAAVTNNAGEDGKINRTSYLQSVHEVLGGSGTFSEGSARGGIQQVRGMLTLLPPGVSGAQVDKVMQILPQRLSAQGEASEKFWTDISTNGAVPSLGGYLPNEITAAQLKIRAVGQDRYVLMKQKDVFSQPSIVMTAEGDPYTFSLKALLTPPEAKK